MAQPNLKVSDEARSRFSELAKAEGIGRSELFEKMVEIWKTRETEPMLPTLFPPALLPTASIAAVLPLTPTSRPVTSLVLRLLAALCVGILLLCGLTLP